MQIPGIWDKELFEKQLRKKPSNMLTATMICLNECDYIWASLMSIYSVVDKIIIVEGATKYAIKDMVSPTGLSTDGTPMLIQAFIDAYDIKGKIKYIRVGFVNDKTELRNRCLEHVPEGTSYLLIVDGDELYMEEDVKKAVKTMIETDALMGQAKHLMFWGSTHNLLEPADGSDHYVMRLLKYAPGMFYKSHLDPFLDPTTSYFADPSRVIKIDELRLFHFGEVKDKRKIVLKRWERLRQMQAECRDIPEYNYLAQRDDYGLYLEAISHSKALNLANLNPSIESIVPYNGPWPLAIINHLNFKQGPNFYGIHMP